MALRGLPSYLLGACVVLFVLYVQADIPSDNKFFNGVISLSYSSNSNFLPEGVDFDRSSEAFILSSLNGAGVVKLSIDDIDHQNDVGSIRNWATGSDARDVLVSTTGVRHDRSRGLTFVCNSRQPIPSSLGGVAVFETRDSNGRLEHYYDLTELRPADAKLINDAAVDGDGNLFVTESLNGVIYHIDLDAEVASVFKVESRLADADVGVNGIAYFHGDGKSSRRAMILSKTHATVEQGGLWHLNLDTREVRQIPIDFRHDEDPVELDGLFMHSTGHLFAASHTGKMFEFETEDHWETASVRGVYELGCSGAASAITVQGGQAYILCPNEFAVGTGPYQMQRISIEDDDEDSDNDDGDSLLEPSQTEHDGSYLSSSTGAMSMPSVVAALVAAFGVFVAVWVQ